ncbi:hypothetical protein [Faecalispora jeddahensis]|uniref:hypothetical protein n=1 Tax=Faecalispora jeddahensis TaxID=1414721 RepID=UPI00145BC441|nr:hypothetical protein [Faecalispora jeddahensis]
MKVDLENKTISDYLFAFGFEEQFFKIIDSLYNKTTSKEMKDAYVNIGKLIYKDRFWLYSTHWAEFLKIALHRNLSINSKDSYPNKTIEDLKEFENQLLNPKLVNKYLNDPSSVLIEKINKTTFYTFLYGLRETPKIKKFTTFDIDYPGRKMTAIPDNYWKNLSGNKNIVYQNLDWLSFFEIPLPKLDNILPSSNDGSEPYEQEEVKLEVEQKCETLADNEIFYICNRFDLFELISDDAWAIICAFNLLNEEGKSIIEDAYKEEIDQMTLLEVLESDKKTLSQQFQENQLKTEYQRDYLINKLIERVWALTESKKSKFLFRFPHNATLSVDDYKMLMIYIKERNESKTTFKKILNALLEGRNHFDNGLDKKTINRFIADFKNPKNNH